MAKRRISCDQCEMLSINGVACHETGCPNSNARYDVPSERWVKLRQCFECGVVVDADDLCCAEPFEEDEPITPWGERVDDVEVS